MKKLLWIVLALMFAYGCGKAPQASAPDTNVKKSFIVGGKVVDPKATDTTFIVSLSGGCGGSIIGSKWILTAAHCQPVFSRGITAGNVDLRASGRIKLAMKKYYIHPDYKETSWGGANDFALIELKNEIDFNTQKALGMVEIATPDLEASGGVDDGVMATVYGWGATREGGMGSSVLREVQVPIVSRERANESYNGVIDESMIAAGYDQGGKDSCQGDSGGPLVTFDQETNKPILVGVVSFGEGCARSKFYGIYSNVAFAHDWIQATMKGSPIN